MFPIANDANNKLRHFVTVYKKKKGETEIGGTQNIPGTTRKAEPYTAQSRQFADGCGI